MKNVLILSSPNLSPSVKRRGQSLFYSMRSVERPFTVYVASFVPSDFPRLCSCEMSRVLSGIFSRNSKCIVKWHFVACFEFLCFNAIWCVYVYNLLELLLLKVLAAIKHVVKNGESNPGLHEVAPFWKIITVVLMIIMQSTTLQLVTCVGFAFNSYKPDQPV